MVRTDLLRGEIARNGFKLCNVAEKLGITPKTLSAKLKKGVFNTAEIDALVQVLHIENPVEIFFAKEVS